MKQPNASAKRDNREQIREYVERWRRVGPILERIKTQELRALDTRKQWRVIASLFDLAVRFGRPRLTSGLVEQQRLFMKVRA